MSILSDPNLLLKNVGIFLSSLKSVIIILFAASSAVLSADDSTRVFHLDDVVITGTKSAVAVVDLPSSVQVVDSLELMQSNGTSLADKLKYISGISLRSYGGNGSLQSVSVRGLGSDYSLILIDGQRYTMFQISTVDLGIFSADEVDRIEIANGGNSSLYGADAVGGVINIITKRPGGGYFASFAQSVGSYGLNGYRITAGGGDERFSFRGSMNVQHAANSFEFIFHDGLAKRTLRRAGADYSMKNYSFSARTVLSDNIVSNYVLRYSDANRGQPAAVTNALQNNLARIQDDDIFTGMTTEMKYAEMLTITVPVSYHHNRQKYDDPFVIIGGERLSAHYENTVISASPSMRYSFSSDHLLTAGSDIAAASITSNELVPAQRVQWSGSLSSMHRFRLPFEVIVYPSVRFDSFSDTEGAISPKIGFNIGVLDEPLLRVRASYGKNYRIPTFNDMYWIDGGNPNVAPEHSDNFDAGMIGAYRFKVIDANFELNYFSVTAKDKIVWQPGLNGMWSPKNLQSVSSSGIELSVNINVLNDLVIMKYRHNFLRAVKTSKDHPNDNTQNAILPYVPQEFSAFTVGSSMSGVSLNLTYAFTGFRYETADNNPRFILPTYETVDANVSYVVSFPAFSFLIKGEINNLLNAEYQLVTAYPTPLRNYLLTTEFSF